MPGEGQESMATLEEGGERVLPGCQCSARERRASHRAIGGQKERTLRSLGERGSNHETLTATFIEARFGLSLGLDYN